MPDVSLEALIDSAESSSPIPFSMPAEARRGDSLGDVRVSDIVYDSRRCRRGVMFIALPGSHTDGHRYISQAVAAGAAVIVHERPFDPAWVSDTEPTTEPVFLRVESARRALSAFAAAFHDHPSRELCVIGVTGTDGKSSTVWFTYQLLTAMGVSAGFISTVSLDTEGEVVDNPWRQSTPEAPEIHASLRRMVNAGKSVAVVEATSHGLSEKTRRLTDLAFDLGVFTNLSHEHLEFHGSYEQYRSDKGNLFRALGAAPGEPGCAPLAIANYDDGEFDYYANLAKREAGVPVMSYSIGAQGADVSAFISEMSQASTRMAVYLSASGRKRRIAAELNLPGWFNVSNALAAVLATASVTSAEPEEVFDKLPALTAVRGRLQPIESDAPFTVIVDYAHTPGSFETVLPLFRDTCEGRLIAVFGSAGERDLEKRPQQGATAARFCDLLVLSDEDPRGENSAHIIGRIAAGARKVRNERTGRLPRILEVPDRRSAIRRAFSEAAAGDSVVLLGKGHEKTIIYADGPREWDEIAVARELLQELGYSLP